MKNIEYHKMKGRLINEQNLNCYRAKKFIFQRKCFFHIKFSLYSQKLLSLYILHILMLALKKI